MTILVAWASGTGNTAKVGRAVASAFDDAAAYAVADAPRSTGFEAAFVGAWLDKGGFAQEAREYLVELDRLAAAEGKVLPVAVFGTMGGQPQSARAREFLGRFYGEWKAAMPHLGWLGFRFWQGRVDPALVERMNALFPMTSERAARIKAAESHPDAADLEQARLWALRMRELARG